MLRRKKSKSRTRRGVARSHLSLIQNHPDPIVSVIIPLCNERKTIASVLRQAYKVHPRTEVIVVANGSRDGSEQVAKRMGASVLHYDAPLGHDVGRSIGALHAKGKVLLFLDGDIIFHPKDLFPFVHAVLQGVDVALNDYSGPVEKAQVHSVVLAKHALNTMLGRPDLKGTSMTTIPHAISRRALELIGSEKLAVPPLAQTSALVNRLRVEPVHHIGVGKKNPRKRRKSGVMPSLIMGDHIEALQWLVQETTSRGYFPDRIRNRDFMG